MKLALMLGIIVGLLVLGVLVVTHVTMEAPPRGPEVLLAPEPIKTVALGQNREFLVNGKQFFPIMIFLVAADKLPQAKALGINTSINYWRMESAKEGADAYAEACRKLDLYFIPPYEVKFPEEMKSLNASPAVLAWEQLDEPDIKTNVMSTEELLVNYRAVKALKPLRPVVLNVSPNIIHDTLFLKRRSRAVMDMLYTEMLRAADVVSFDAFPFCIWDQPEKIAWVSQGLVDLRNYAGRNKPAFEIIETVGYDEAHPMTGVEIRNEVWQSIINGATAVCYYTHQFHPVHKEFGVSEANQKVILEINRQLVRLTAVLLAADAPEQPLIKIEDKVAAQCLAKQSGEWLYIFAQNIDGAGKAGRGTIWWSGLKAGTKIEVVDEGRQLEAIGGQFSDDFTPLAVHIYRMKVPEK